jgi:hypothetical protein
MVSASSGILRTAVTVRRTTKAGKRSTIVGEDTQPDGVEEGSAARDHAAGVLTWGC